MAGWRRPQADFDEEIRAHLALEADRLRAEGWSARDAEWEARRRFGNVTRAQERFRWSRLPAWLDAVGQDLRHTARQLRREPGFTLVAILTLAVGIAANAVMFGVVDRLLLRPPAHVVEPQRVGRLYLATTQPTGERDARSVTSYLRMTELRDGGRAVAQVAGLSSWGRGTVIGRGADAEEVRAAYATADLFPLLGVRPHLGRFYAEAEDVPPGGSRVAVIGHGLWRRRFGGDSTAIGRTLRIESDDYEIVGVAPAGFGGLDPDEVDVWRPATTAAAMMGGGDGWATTHDWHWIEPVVRLREGVSRERAEAVLGTVHARSVLAELESRRPSRQGAPTGPEPTATLSAMHPTATVAPAHRERGPQQTPSARVALWLTGVAGVVLLIACANVANLLLARSMRRRREIAVRLALGISRGRLVGQLVLESVVLALAGALVGLALAWWGAQAVGAVLTPGGDAARFDGRVLTFTAVAATLAGLLAGLAPALQSIRPHLAVALRAGARDGGGRRGPLRTGLLVAQAALSTVLLVGAGLFVRSLHEAGTTNLGFEPERLVLATIEYRGAQPEGIEARDALDSRILERLREAPGVVGVTTAASLPNLRHMTMSLATESRDSVPGAFEMYLNVAGDDFFPTIGGRIVRGRAFDARDVRGGEPVMIVSESMARRVWPARDAVGQCLRIAYGDCTRVVGVAANVAHEGLDADSTLQYWVPHAQRAGPSSAFAFVARVHGDPADAVAALRAAVQGVLPGDAYANVRPMRELTDPRLHSWRLGATMFALFGALSLVIAAVGLYGVIAYHVQQRRHELGVRQALGASAVDLRRAVLGEGLRVVSAGLAIGALVSLAAARWLEPLLYRVSPRDPLTYIAVVVVLLAAAVLACVAPARRAARVNPSEALRSE